MIRFRLKSGEIIEAKKDCDCLTHEGPHWLHVLDLDHALCRQDRLVWMKAYEVYCRHPAAEVGQWLDALANYTLTNNLYRLRRLSKRMKDQGIEEIIRC